MTPGRPVPPPLNLRIPLAETTPGPLEGRLAAARGASSESSGLVALTVARRAPKADDVEIAIEFCGLCHSDVHATRGSGAARTIPSSRATRSWAGSAALARRCEDFRTRRPGGCWLHCGLLPGMRELPGRAGTVLRAGPDRDLRCQGRRNGDAITQGGYATSVVVDRRYVLRVPENLDPAAAAPLLCAGVTTFSPLRHFGVQEGDVVGVVGLGGPGSHGRQTGQGHGRRGEGLHYF